MPDQTPQLPVAPAEWQQILTAAYALVPDDKRDAIGEQICEAYSFGVASGVQRQDATQGYAEAVARLRDDARYTNWWTSGTAKPDGRIRHHLADYLETVGPDGIDVSTGRWPAREHAVIRAAIAWRRLWTTTVLATPEVRALIEAVDALPDAGESQASEPADNDLRECANCGELVGFLSSRDWCDGCEEEAAAQASEPAAERLAATEPTLEGGKA